MSRQLHGKLKPNRTKRAGNLAAKKSSTGRGRSGDNNLPGDSRRRGRVGSVGSAITRGVVKPYSVVRQHPLVGRIFRALVPFDGVARSVLFRVTDFGASFRTGAVVRVRTIPTMDQQRTTSRWVGIAEMELLTRVGLLTYVDELPCPCGAKMRLILNGEVDNVPKPFFACHTCENCVAV